MPAAKINRKQLALVHIARAKLGLDEDDYRNMLRHFGVETSKDLTVPQFRQLISQFQRLGFQSTNFDPSRAGTGRKATGSPKAHMTDAQRKKIIAIWHQVSKAPATEHWKALDTFVYKRTGIARLNWLKVADAQKIIVVLEAMKQGRRLP